MLKSDLFKDFQSCHPHIYKKGYRAQAALIRGGYFKTENVCRERYYTLYDDIAYLMAEHANVFNELSDGIDHGLDTSCGEEGLEALIKRLSSCKFDLEKDTYYVSEL